MAWDNKEESHPSQKWFNKRRSVHSASLTDMCHLKHSELAGHLQETQEESRAQGSSHGATSISFAKWRQQKSLNTSFRLSKDYYDCKKESADRRG